MVNNTNQPYQIILEQAKQNKLGHAYLFVGQNLTLKDKIILDLIKLITRTDGVKSHPDVVRINLDDIQNVDQLRSLILQFSSKPLVAAKRIIIIDNFDKATVFMSNSLLKFIEETPPDNLIIFNSLKNNALPTIISRCQLFYFNDLVINSSVTAENVILEQLKSIDKLSDYEKIILINKLSELDSPTLKELLELWSSSLRTSLTKHPANIFLVNMIVRALDELSRAVNKKMVLQNVMFYKSHAV